VENGSPEHFAAMIRNCTKEHEMIARLEKEKKMLSAVKSDLHIESELGDGSLFFFFLPTIYETNESEEV